MPSLWEVLKTSKGLPAPDGFTALFAHSLSDTYTLAETSGIPPLNLGEIVEIVDYTIYGNTYQSENVSPDTPQEVKGCGDRTANLLNFEDLLNAPEGRMPDADLTVPHVLVLHLKPNTTYTCSSNGTGSTKLTPADLYRSLYFCRGEATNSVNVDNSITYTTDSTGQVIVGFFDGRTNAQQYLNQTAYVMLNEGSTPLPYEPYGYKLDVVTRGKNLFDIEKWLTDNGVTYTKNEGVYTFETKYTMFTTPLYFSDTDIPITISGIIRNISATYARVTLVKADGTIAHENALTASTTVTKNITCAGLKFDWSAGGTVSFSNIMINTGTTSEPYEPYTPPITTPIYLDSPLYKIGDYSDSIGSKEEFRVIKELVLTGEEKWSVGSANYYCPLSLKGIPYSNVICTHAKNGSTIDNNGTNLYLQKSAFVFDTLDDFKSYLAAQYAAGTPVKVYYVLAEPESKVVNPVEIPTIQGANIIDINTEVKPSNLKITYKSKM